MNDFSMLPPAGQNFWFIPMEEVALFRRFLKGKRVVVTNGCFDLFHVGHLTLLNEAKKLGDFLWVGINGDQSVRELKGDNRPFFPAWERAAIVGSLKGIDAVTIFTEKRATRFLSLVKPAVYVKGADYTSQSLDQEEKEVLNSCQALIKFIPLYPDRSTSSTVERIRKGSLMAEQNK
ncbi:adenylyltransferase/cytidyltransferase family protein [Candidatus Methylacidiphilum infernorum]|uniref:Adenylyltransferase/cytidyltransferase family protein n=1 Tax=Candidatus Methylacidiphilum infernorum TaxID=511746 RepID=A0ABX7PV81_9BACT|nr:adenylyltransferase/cytidyltransferase family protein [Candidatus Methylacidiphilum infernorum]QSR86588.1 adenylyltransferase/cytidyltransferase family protein [Candidatus Methylacidiphilum infernorum]